MDEWTNKCTVQCLIKNLINEQTNELAGELLMTDGINQESRWMNEWINEDCKNKLHVYKQTEWMKHSFGIYKKWFVL